MVPGHPFIRRIIDLTRGLKKPHHVVRLTKEIKADLQVWKIFCDSFNEESVILPTEWETSNTLKLFTDASDISWFQMVCSKMVRRMEKATYLY